MSTPTCTPFTNVQDPNYPGLLASSMTQYGIAQSGSQTSEAYVAGGSQVCVLTKAVPGATCLDTSKLSSGYGNLACTTIPPNGSTPMLTVCAWDPSSADAAKTVCQTTAQKIGPSSKF